MAVNSFFFNYRALVIFLLVISLHGTYSYANQNNSSVPTYSFHRGGISAGRIPFETSLAARLLEISEERFGPANIIFLDQAMSAYRTRVSVENGKALHFFTGAWVKRTDQYPDMGQSSEMPIVISQPILKNLLGYRRMIARRSELESLSLISSMSKFKQLQVGQGEDWPDVEVFELNSIPVVGADKFYSLFPMLVRGRFDYISLGASEVKGLIELQQAFKKDLGLVENIVLFYPWPIHFFVSRSVPELAERLEYGLREIMKTGEFDLLFNKHYANVLRDLNNSSTKVFVLKPISTSHTKDDVRPILLDQAVIYE